VDYLVVEFPAGVANFTGEMAAELAALAEVGTIRLLDLLVLHKDDDGVVEAFEIDDLDELPELVALEAEIAEILTAAPLESSCGRTFGRHRSLGRHGEPVGS
jgi:hypothetical protein